MVGPLHLVHVVERLIDGGVVHVDHVMALDGVGSPDRRLDPRDRIVTRDDIGDGEIAGLHDGVDAPPHARIHRHLLRVDDVDLQVLLDDLLLHDLRQLIPGTLRAMRRIEQEISARGGILEDVHMFEEIELMAGDEPRLADQIGRPDGVGADPEMRDRHRSRFLGIVDEIALGVEIRVLSQNLDRVLVGSDRAVGTETEEDCPLHLLALGGKRLVDVERKAGHVVDDSDGEMRFRLFPGQFVEHRLDHGRGEFLRR